MPEHQETEASKSTYSKEFDAGRAEVLSLVLQEHDVISAQRERRRQLLLELEEETKQQGDSKRSVGYVGFFCSSASAIDSDDIPAFGDALMSLGEVDELNLILSSPGGDGTTAEKMIELCRAYCKVFRVIVPNRAKSAATIIALGSDQIVMGYCSELGPIDAQVPVIVGGLPRYVSAQSFLDARSSLEERFHQSLVKKEDPRAILQQIASLDIPFLDHCEKLMDFSREVAKKYLSRYMFQKIKPKKLKDETIAHVLSELSTVGIFKVHGRMINANTAKTDLKLNVELLGKDHSLWKKLWHYYVRADVQLNRASGLGKLIETRNEVLYRA